ncbi:replicative DNA helicase [Bifidobacterium minimum]|jgi:replicative DNA helicase|uniref:Replicative DNA helicase n=3 Tax=Bifidobacterium minimum TaxID=1693 RepID=A0A087BR93_9BIFI|nr:replicative DNA helicase [Bifidobacterium minimum]KFI73543.1 replicative DNA helicase [Bifidobacterium minimum]MCH4159273.1 replicative DNA helicase [Bifidobacterium minimum]
MGAQGPDRSSASSDRGAVSSEVVFDRVPPHDDEAEMAVLGGMLMSKDAIGEVSQMLSATDFYEPRNQTVYQSVVDLFAASQPVDVVLVANRLLKDGDLDKVGGADYLHSLVASVPTAANATYYAQIVHQRAILRNVIATGTKIVQLGYSAEGSQAEDVVNLAQSEVYEMSVGKIRQDYSPIGTVVHDTLDQLDKMQNNEIEKGVPTGFRDIDDVTQGLQPGQMVVVAGRPAMGKSTLGIDFARSAALHHNMTAVVFSLEMSKVELAQRIISAETNIPLVALRRADDITSERWNTLNNFWTRLQDAPLFIDDSPNMSLMEIRAKCRRLKQTNDLKLVVIDYLQLMSSGKKVESRQQEVSEFSRALKLLAKELEVPVVALSQLNRGPEMRNDRKPQLSDLRESGSIEQDADVVMLVHRPDFYDKEDRPGEADIIMAKHRNGPTETFHLAFLGATSKFKDMPQDSQQGV